MVYISDNVKAKLGKNKLLGKCTEVSAGCHNRAPAPHSRKVDPLPHVLVLTSMRIRSSMDSAATTLRS